MSDRTIAALLFAGGLLVVTLIGTYVEVRNWAECRATPHTVFYCLTAGGR